MQHVRAPARPSSTDRYYFSTPACIAAINCRISRRLRKLGQTYCSISKLWCAQAQLEVLFLSTPTHIAIVDCSISRLPCATRWTYCCIAQLPCATGQTYRNSCRLLHAQKQQQSMRSAHAVHETINSMQPTTFAACCELLRCFALGSTPVRHWSDIPQHLSTAART